MSQFDAQPLGTTSSVVLRSGSQLRAAVLSMSSVSETGSERSTRSAQVWEEFCSEDRVSVSGVWTTAEDNGGLSPCGIFLGCYGHMTCVLRLSPRALKTASLWCG